MGLEGGGKTLVYHLSQGVRWHDGQPFGSKHVQYTFVKGRPYLDGIRHVLGDALRDALDPRLRQA